MIQSERTYMNKAFQTNSFNYKAFLSHYNHQKKKEKKSASEEIINHFIDCDRRENVRRMQQNSLLEEAIYLRTRKRIMDDCLKQQAGEASKDSPCSSTVNIKAKVGWFCT